MRRGVVAGSSLSDYRATLSESLPFNRILNRRILDEINDHIAEATDHWLSRGLARDEAERRAIDRMGPAPEVARAFARSRGLGMATRTTQLGGMAGTLAPFAVFGGVWLLDIDQVGDEGHWVGGTLVILGILSVFFFMYALWKRHAGSLGGWGRSALSLAVVSPLLSLPFGWGAPLALIGFLGGSFILMGIGIWMANEMPRIPMLLVATGPAWVLGVGGAGAIAGFDGALYMPFGMIPIAAGLVWLGRALWVEPSEENRSPDLPAMA